MIVPSFLTKQLVLWKGSAPLLLELFSSSTITLHIQEGPCRQCYCRPMWCTGCMGKWFASRQSQRASNVWMESTAPCPMCRATFCMADVLKLKVPTWPIRKEMFVMCFLCVNTVSDNVFHYRSITWPFKKNCFLRNLCQWVYVQLILWNWNVLWIDIFNMTSR